MCWNLKGTISSVYSETDEAPGNAVKIKIIRFAGNWVLRYSHKSFFRCREGILSSDSSGTVNGKALFWQRFSGLLGTWSRHHSDAYQEKRLQSLDTTEKFPLIVIPAPLEGNRFPHPPNAVMTIFKTNECFEWIFWLFNVPSFIFRAFTHFRSLIPCLSHAWFRFHLPSCDWRFG